MSVLIHHDPDTTEAVEALKESKVTESSSCRITLPDGNPRVPSTIEQSVKTEIDNSNLPGKFIFVSLFDLAW